MKEQIVIVGYGWVGQANAIALSKMGYSVSFFDPHPPDLHYQSEYANEYEKVGQLSYVLENDSPLTWYIICVGDVVSEDGVQDVSRIQSAVESLSGRAGHLIIRSTIRPDYLEKFSFDFYLPEFLHEKAAVAECISPHYLVIGEGSAALEPSFFAAWERVAGSTFRGTPKEASHIKYLSNLWNALRIAFVNEMGASIASPDSPEHRKEIDRVLAFLFGDALYMKYGRAFKGHCLPKDSRAYARYIEDLNGTAALLRGMYESNTAQLKKEEHTDMPEWFSNWENHTGSTT